MHTFVGFGRFDADVWFIGIEQGGGKDIPELARRIEAWGNLGCPEVTDLHQYCDAIDERQWHGPNAKYQRTLAQMVRILFAAQERPISTRAIIAYQAEQLGRV